MKVIHLPRKGSQTKVFRLQSRRCPRSRPFLFCFPFYLKIKRYSVSGLPSKRRARARFFLSTSKQKKKKDMPRVSSTRFYKTFSALVYNFCAKIPQSGDVWLTPIPSREGVGLLGCCLRRHHSHTDSPQLCHSSCLRRFDGYRTSSMLFDLFINLCA